MKRLLLIFSITPLLLHAQPSAEQIEFFEKRIRPVLAQECYECHSTATKKKGGLLLDTRAGWQEGGDSGPALVPGKPNESLLLKSIRHEDPDLKMPKAGAKMDDSAIADIQKWIAMGAPDPRDHPPSVDQVKGDTSWQAIAARRERWWSFQPVAETSVPTADAAWSAHPVDKFLREKQMKNHLAPAEDADVATVLRRLHYVLTGLPATDLEGASFAQAWSKLGAEKAIAARVDELLQSPHFGERWARHWMDWFRYSEGHGSQGDPAVENAFEYRDYLIRALNSNVPYDQLIREHLAGDLLPKPRLDGSGTLNESRIGLAQYRFVEHGYFPVDALDELVKFTDNQIDVVTKATLGLTVSCARCHDHKFDAISQRDYHALFGIFASSRPAQRPLMTKAALDSHRTELRQARTQLASTLKIQWLAEATPQQVRQRLDAWSRARVESATADAAPKAEKNKAEAPVLQPVSDTDLLSPWNAWREREDMAKQWSAQAERLKQLRAEAAAHNAKITLQRWDLRTGLPADWYLADGRVTPHTAGELGLGVSDGDAVLSILPAGLLTHESSAFEQAAIASRDLTLPAGAFAVRWAGAGGALARIATENYPISGSLYGQFDVGEAGISEWFSRGTDFWKGQRGYFHVMTRQAAPSAARKPTPKGYGANGATATRGSWFSIAEVRLLKGPKDVVKSEQFSIAPLLAGSGSPPQHADELAKRYATALGEVLQRWQTPAFTDEDALFLTDCLTAGLIHGGANGLDVSANEALRSLRKIEDSFAAAARRAAPGVMESPGFDQPLYARGNHLTPGERVPRAFLASLGGKPYAPQNASGRLQLAQELTRAENPLFARVLANRLWHHVFGRGLVATTDNFGRTGEQPTHPELLDHLATRLVRSGFDLKDAIGYLLETRTFRLCSTAPAASTAADPANRLLTHAPVRRMDAEVIRDHLLAISGNLDPKLYGPSTPLKAAPPADTRRGLYVQTKRAGQNELFASFDVPVPNTTRCTRDVTTTPGQSITLLNSPFIRHQARIWAEHAEAAIAKGSTVDAELRHLIVHAFSRQPSEDELTALRAYHDSRYRDGTLIALQQTAHLVFNLKEFIFLP